RAKCLALRALRLLFSDLLLPQLLKLLSCSSISTSSFASQVGHLPLATLFRGNVRNSSRCRLLGGLLGRCALIVQLQLLVLSAIRNCLGAHGARQITSKRRRRQR